MKRLQMLNLAAGLILSAACSLAQGPGMGGPRMGGPRRAMTLAGAPIEALQKGLGLKPDQAKKIGGIIDKLRSERRAMFEGMRGGGPGGPGMGGPGGPGGGMQAMMQKMQVGEKKATDQINAILTPAQRAQAPALVKQLDAARSIGLPVQVVPDLKLSPAQVSKMEALGKSQRDQMMKMFAGGRPGGPGGPGMMGGPRPGGPGMGRPGGRPGAPGGSAMMGGPGGGMDGIRKMMEGARAKARAILTKPQQAIVDKYEKEHPRRGMGGPGMGGPGGPGGPGMMGGPGPMGRPGGGMGGPGGRRGGGR